MCKTNLSEDEVKELDFVKSQLETMDLKGIQGNKIRSGAKWLESNEQPSHFFFQKEKRRAAKKTCLALRTTDGRRVTEQDDISKEQVRFYKELYSNVPTDKVALPWFQRFIFIIFIAKGRGKINLWLKAAIDSSSRANQFELGSDPDSVS